MPTHFGVSNPNDVSPIWFGQTKSIGSVVCPKINSQEDRINLNELRGQDLTSIIHNNIIPWASHVNESLSSFREGLSLIYNNTPGYLNSMKDHIQQLFQRDFRGACTSFNLVS